MKMPIFVWSALCAMVLVIFAFPILTATLVMLTLDRYLGMHFFTAGAGGNPMMYVNLIWAWGHPEVYILILPAFGIFSEVVPTFSEKRLFGYVSMVWALSGHHISFLYRLAASLLYHGRKLQCQRLFRHHDDADCDPHRRQDLQLALY